MQTIHYSQFHNYLGKRPTLLFPYRIIRFLLRSVAIFHANHQCPLPNLGEARARNTYPFETLTDGDQKTLRVSGVGFDRTSNRANGPRKHDLGWRKKKETSREVESEVDARRGKVGEEVAEGGSDVCT